VHYLAPGGPGATLSATFADLLAGGEFQHLTAAAKKVLGELTRTVREADVAGEPARCGNTPARSRAPRVSQSQGLYSSSWGDFVPHFRLLATAEAKTHRISCFGAPALF
jgi:hypothetical protein